MKALVLVIVFVAGNAMAYGYKKNSANFVISNFAQDGSRVYYNCASVEDSVDDTLKTLGAKDIRVRCTGGLDQWSMPTPAYVRASFRSISAEVNGNLSTSMHTEDLDARDNCHLNFAVFKGVQKYFEISSFNMGRCFRPSDRTRLTVDVLKEDI